jgi:hypothetical protein
VNSGCFPRNVVPGFPPIAYTRHVRWKALPAPWFTCQDPEVQAQMMQVMASTYENLGLYARAHELAKRALDSRLTLRGEDDPRTLESMAQLGWILAREGHDSEAENLERRALVGERHTLGPEDPLTLETMDHLAVVAIHQGHHDESEKLSAR